MAKEQPGLKDSVSASSLNKIVGTLVGISSTVERLFTRATEFDSQFQLEKVCYKDQHHP